MAVGRSPEPKKILMKKKVGFLFPGQGSQFVGMGVALNEKYASAKNIFSQADKILGFKLSEICASGPEDVLTRTLYAQPAIYTSSCAAFAVFQEKFPDIKPQVVAGHSLGEFSALAAAGFFSFEDGLKLVQIRAQAMEKAATQNPGAMAAILGLSQADCISVAQEAGAEVANFNSPLQTVLTGAADAIARACSLAEQKGAKRVMPLKVSGAFHSTLMKAAQLDLCEALTRVQVKTPNCSFIPNVTGSSNNNPIEIKDLLGKQLVSSVRWTETMQKINLMELTHLVEVGPGKVLKGLAKSCETKTPVSLFGLPTDVEEIIKNFEGAIHA